MQSRHRAEEFIAAYNRKDVPGALACFTEDAVYQDVTYGTHSGQGELSLRNRLKLLPEQPAGQADADRERQVRPRLPSRVAQRVEVDAQELRIMDRKACSCARWSPPQAQKRRGFAVPSFVPKWRARRDSNS